MMNLEATLPATIPPHHPFTSSPSITATLPLQVEAGTKHPDSVRIALLEFNRKFGPRDASDAGITVWDFLVRFFLNNAMPQVNKGGGAAGSGKDGAREEGEE
jgi:hypothetical protein